MAWLPPPPALFPWGDKDISSGSRLVSPRILAKLPGLKAHLGHGPLASGEGAQPHLGLRTCVQRAIPRGSGGPGCWTGCWEAEAAQAWETSHAASNPLQTRQGGKGPLDASVLLRVWDREPHSCSLQTITDAPTGHLGAYKGGARPREQPLDTASAFPPRTMTSGLTCPPFTAKACSPQRVCQEGLLLAEVEEGVYTACPGDSCCPCRVPGVHVSSP